MRIYKYVSELVEQLQGASANNVHFASVFPVFVRAGYNIDVQLLMDEICELYESYTDMEFTGADKVLFFCPKIGDNADDFMRDLISTMFKSANAAYTNEFKGIVIVDLSEYMCDAYNLLVRAVMSYINAYRDRVAFVMLLSGEGQQFDELLDVAGSFMPYILVEPQQQKWNLQTELKTIACEMNISYSDDTEKKLLDVVSSICLTSSYQQVISKMRFLLEQALVENHFMPQIGADAVERAIKKHRCLKDLQQSG